MKPENDQEKLLQLLCERLPEGKLGFYSMGENVSIYSMINKLMEVTSISAHNHQFKLVKRCFLVADELLCSGSGPVKNAICTSYVCALSRLLHKPVESAEVLRFLLPPHLKAEYHRQLAISLP